MAKLYVDEFMDPGIYAGWNEPLAPPVAHQQVAITAQSVASNAFGDSTRMVEIHADDACHFAIGATPTAAAGTSMHLAAGERVRRAVEPGHKIAVIAVPAE